MKNVVVIIIIMLLLAGCMNDELPWITGHCAEAVCGNTTFTATETDSVGKHKMWNRSSVNRSVLRCRVPPENYLCYVISVYGCSASRQRAV